MADPVHVRSENRFNQPTQKKTHCNYVVELSRKPTYHDRDIPHRRQVRIGYRDNCKMATGRVEQGNGNGIIVHAYSTHNFR